MPCQTYEPPRHNRYASEAKNQMMEQARNTRLQEIDHEKALDVKKLDDQIAALTRDLDDVTHDGCVLRERYLQLMEQTGAESKHLQKIYTAQVEHRKMDLDRCADTLEHKIKKARTIKSLQKYQKMLDLVRAADVRAPLEAQIGFDPDSI